MNNQGNDTSRVPLSLSAAFDRMHLAGAPANLEAALGTVAVERRVLQDFCPLSESLEWRLSDLEWASAGTRLFADGEVPFIVNNSGRMSEAAAVLLYANCEEAKSAGDIHICEFGAGTGLFARYLLDAFQSICRQEGRDYYERLVFVITDRASRTVEDWRQRQLFDGHADRVRLATADASQPGEEGVLASLRSAGISLQAVFFNYVLDVLPATVLRSATEGPEEMVVRTHRTNDPSLVRDDRRPTPAEIEALTSKSATIDPRAILPLIGALDLEVAFRPCAEPLPAGAEDAFAAVDSRTPVVVNHGAIASLEACLRLLSPSGFILLNDYGSIRAGTGTVSAAQRFGPTTATGLNFVALDRYFQRSGWLAAIPDESPEQAIHSRLIARLQVPQTVAAFRNRFAGEAQNEVDQVMTEARLHAAAGRMNVALAGYKAALGRAPRDWRVVGEVAEFVGLQLNDFATGLELARGAVALNPWYSTWLWNVLGDCCYCLERIDDSHEAYLQAARIGPDDPRTNLNLAYTHLQRGDYEAALAAIALGLASDGRSQYRDRLLAKQQQILAALSARWLGDEDRLRRRAARLTQLAQPEPS